MPTWNELFHQEELRWREPHERVIELASLIKERHPSRQPCILDLGCGAGRHMVYLARQSFRVHGMDLAISGLGYTRKWLDEEGLQGTISCADMTALPYASESFDALISIHVIYHTLKEEMNRTISEIERVLIPGGMALLTFQSRRSGRYGQGSQLEPNTFMPDTGLDNGIPHHFSDLTELADQLRAFVVRKVILEEHFSENLLNSHWEVIIEKNDSRIHH